MILAIYTKNKPKDKWTLHSLADSMDDAKKYSEAAIKLAKEIGYDHADAAVQGFISVHDIPKVLEKLKPEKLLYN